MHITRLGGLAALAGLSHGFLIPPSINEIVNKAIDAMPFEALASANSEQLVVDCPGCPLILSKDNAIHHAQSKLRLNITVQPRENEGDALLINDYPVMPDVPSAAHGTLHADQLIQGPNGDWYSASQPSLGYSLRVKAMPPFHDREHPDLNLYRVHFRVMEVGNEFVRRVPAIDIELIRTPSGKLMIAKTHIQRVQHHDVVAVISEPECNGMFCRWRITFKDKVSSLRKGCGRKGGMNRFPRPNGIFKGGPAGHPRPAGFEHHRVHGYRHHRHGAFARFVQGVIHHLVIPMAIGAAVGITASVLGAVIGQLIVLIWRTFFRRGERGDCNRDRKEEGDETFVGDEKVAFLEAQEAPPVYEDAEVVEEVEKK